MSKIFITFKSGEPPAHANAHANINQGQLCKLQHNNDPSQIVLM